MATGLLAAYDNQLRGRMPGRLPDGVTVERDGPLFRFQGLTFGGFIGYRDLGGMGVSELDELIARQVRAFAERGERFEWKYHGHDLPIDLPERLHAAGFVAEETETVVIAPVAQIAVAPRLPDGVQLQEVSGRADLERIERLQRAVWQDDDLGIADFLEAERSADPDLVRIFVAVADASAVSAAWVRFEANTEFATFWGGATHEAWRGRGIYRALVAHRANLAAERGFRYVEIDASNDSRPILERLGFVPVTTTTPYIWSPPSPNPGESGTAA